MELVSKISYRFCGVDCDLNHAGAVVLDTSAIPDVIRLRARDNDAEPTQVLPGRAQNSTSVWVLIPDDRAAPWGFHDVTLVDMAGATGPSVSREELSALRQKDRLIWS